MQTVQITLEPGSGLTLTFTWDCEYSSRGSLDEVHLTSTCLGGTVVLRPGDPEVSHSVIGLPNGRVRHTLTKTGFTCQPGCNYSFYAVSATDFVSSDGSASPVSFKTKICVQ